MKTNTYDVIVDIILYSYKGIKNEGEKDKTRGESERVRCTTRNDAKQENVTKDVCLVNINNKKAENTRACESIKIPYFIYHRMYAHYNLTKKIEKS